MRPEVRVGRVLDEVHHAVERREGVRVLRTVFHRPRLVRELRVCQESTGTLLRLAGQNERGILVVAVGLLFFNWLVASNQPGWVANAKSRPLLDAVGQKLQNLMPDDPENSILKRLKPDAEEEAEPAEETPTKS